MNLSRVLIDPRSAEGRRWLASPQVMHARILRAVGHPEPGRLLWRVDTPPSGPVELYVVSQDPWDGEPMAREAGDVPHGWRTAPYEALLDRLATGQRWVFRLTANPTTSVAAERGSRGRVVPLVTRAQQEDWLADRAARFGICLGSSPDERTWQLVEQRRLDFRRRPDGPGSRVHLATATYTGTLTVHEPSLLRTALTDGVGRAKAYGCGLLTLAPVP